MNLHEKIALMIIVTALVVTALVGVFAGDASNPEQAGPEVSDQTVTEDEPSNIALISEDAELTANGAEAMDVPTIDEAQDEEVEEFLPALPGFLRPALESDPEVLEPAVTQDSVQDTVETATEATSKPAFAVTAKPTTEAAAPTTEIGTEAVPEVTAEITTSDTAEATTEAAPVTVTEPTTAAEPTTPVTTPAETTVGTTPAATTEPIPETTKAPETQKPVTETAKPETAEPAPEVDPVPDETDLRTAMIEMAKSQIGVVEEPYNNVKYNTWYYGREVSETHEGATSYAWCIVFLSWCADQSDVPTDVFPRIGSVSSLMDFFAEQGRYHSRDEYTPKAGDVVFFGRSHAGLVVSVDDGKITVVEGNYSDSVARTTYEIGSSKLTGYGSPRY